MSHSKRVTEKERVREESELKKESQRECQGERTSWSGDALLVWLGVLYPYVPFPEEALLVIRPFLILWQLDHTRTLKLERSRAFSCALPHESNLWAVDKIIDLSQLRINSFFFPTLLTPTPQNLLFLVQELGWCPHPFSLQADMMVSVNYPWQWATPDAKGPGPGAGLSCVHRHIAQHSVHNVCPFEVLISSDWAVPQQWC